MIEVEPGHCYRLDLLDGGDEQTLTFVKRDGCYEDNHGGTTNQEVLRALIARVLYLDQQLPAHENGAILQHLRMALILHECRSLRRKVETGKLLPESLRAMPID